MALRQSFRFVTSRDGTRIAIAKIGSGPPLLRAAHWLSHIQYDLESPVWRPWIKALSQGNTYVRYDQRGCGLSDRDPANISFQAWLEDLETVADTITAPKFPILGMSQGAALAIAYALLHPDRVSKLVLVGGYARLLPKFPLSEAQQAEVRMLLDAIRIGWGRRNPAFRNVFTSLFIPGGTPEQLNWWSELERISSRPEIAARTLERLFEVDVSDLASQLRIPVLVMHSRGDAVSRFEEGKRLASLIPGARFVPLESKNHVILQDEPSWPHFIAELRAFLADEGPVHANRLADGAGLSPAEAEVLALVAEGLNNRAISVRLGKSEKTVRNQMTAILSKLGVNSRAEAIVRAIRN
jgi:pimeloyl-ACP methyl ester carboxylesterase/DNA-binding CsgD family transcriptional regulator